ncbi:hypothetical protein NK718_18790 [Alsobacter sp. SYSU M60028]|uniref:DUF202 domain-containing protein n=1 Tax=Alsobacter ponti TaxID=2962936 RepID=A0ABT1LGE9_9HYPH|nr:hypothetical protein [Alsobacter ponti]MCP8940577.1 hypothetical protein [Alsobacter ponti]
MSEGDIHDRVVMLEERLEALARAAAACRKMMTGARLAIAVSGLWLVAMAVGLLRDDPVWLVAAIAGLLGGVVFLGSNRSTLAQVEAEIAEVEEERAGLIEGARLRLVVSNDRPTLH